MSLMYIVLVPLSLLVLYKRAVQIINDLKDRNQSKLKADIFFLLLTLLIIILLVWLIERV
jgi:cell division protein FtsW (lipid II flippase)